MKSSYVSGLAVFLLVWVVTGMAADDCPTCPDTSLSACRRWGSGRAKFQWASGESVSSGITLTAGTCGQPGEGAIGYILAHADTHTAVCNDRTACDDALSSLGTIAIIRITGDQKAFEHTLGGIGFTGDKVYTSSTGGQYYSHTSVIQTGCDYSLPLSSASGSRIRVSASVGQCNSEYNSSKFNIIVKFYDVVGDGTSPNRYSLLSSVTGTITIKTNDSRDFDPIAFKPDLRDGSSLSGMKETVRVYSEANGQDEWMINYRGQTWDIGSCENKEGWCGPWGGVEDEYLVPYAQTFYRVKYPGWENSVQGQPPYTKESGWNYEPSGNRLIYDMGDQGKMYYHCQAASDDSVRIRTIERCTSSQDAGEGTVQWTVVYDEQDRIQYIHNASYADPNNPPDPNDITDATQCYVYDYTTGSNTPSIIFQSRATTSQLWPTEPDRQWQLEFDEEGRAVKFQGGCSSCSGTGSFEHIAYHEDYEDAVIWRKNADGVVLIENEYEEIEFGQYEPAGWLYVPDADFEEQDVPANDEAVFENQLFGWNSVNTVITAKIHDPNLNSQYLEIKGDTLYQDLYAVMSNTVYKMDVAIRAHTQESQSFAQITLNAVQGANVEELAIIDVNDLDLTEGSWMPKSVQWDSTPYSDPDAETCLINYDNPWIIQIVMTGNKVDIDAIQLSTSLWVGGNTKPLVKEQKVWAEGQANPVTTLKRNFTADRAAGIYRVVERRYVQTGQDACRVTVYDYADDSFTTVVKTTEYENLGTSTTLPTGDGIVTTFGGDDPNHIYITLAPNSKREDVHIYENGNLIESYIQNTDNDANSLRELYEYEDMDMDELAVNWKIKKHINARGGITDYEYYTDLEWRGLLKKQTDPNTPSGRQVTEYVYDGARRVIRQTQTLDAERTLITRYTYNPTTGYLDAVSVNGISSQYYYNSFGQVIRQVDPDGVVTGKSYGTGGELVSEFVISENTADPNGVDTSLTLISQTRYTYTANGQVEFIGKYNSDGDFAYQSDMIVNPNNWIITKHEYYADGKQKKVIEDYGTSRTNLTTEYFYNLQGEIEKVLYPTGKWVKTIRDGRGLVILEETGYSTDSVVMQSAYDYDANGNLQWQKDPDGTEVHYTYDNYDRLKRTYQGSLSGPYTERFYNEAGDVEREIACEADGTVLSDRWMEYDALGNLRSERLCADPNSLDNAADLITHYSYDVSGNLRYEIKAGLTNTDPNGNPTESDIVTEYRYDNQGRRSLMIDPNGFQYSTDYTQAGRVIKTVSPIDTDDPNAFISEYFHDPYGRQEKTVNPLGHYTVTFYNSFNQVIRQTVYDCNSTPDSQDDFAVRQSRTFYDNLGNVIRQTVMEDPATEGDVTLGVDLVSDTIYDPNGTGLVYQQKTYVGTEATPAVTTFYYDAIGRLRRTIDPEGNEEIITYYTLEDGNPSQIQKVEQKEVNSEDAQEHYTITTFVVYDDFGRLYARILDKDGDGELEATDPNTHFTYDGLGRLKSETANNGVVTFYNYDGFGNVQEKIDDYGTGTENRTTEFVYNRLNQQWKILAYDPNDTTQDVDVQVTEYTFDKNGNVTHITYPDEKSVEYVYNLLNKVDTEIQRNGTEIYYWYDWAGNLRYESDDPDGPDSTGVPTLLTEFRYDAAGNLIYAWKGIDLEDVSESSFTYNGFGARTSETVCYDGDFTQTTTWTYDGSGNCLTQIHGNNVLTTTYDGLNRIKTLDRGNDQIVSYAYMGKNTKSISYPEPDVVQSFVYDDLGRVEQVRSAEDADQTILDFIYTYDEVGNRKQCQYNHLSPVVYDKYYYDTLNRLWKVEYAQTSGFALNTEGDSLPMDVLVLVASAWLNCECDFGEAVQVVFDSGKMPVYLSQRMETIKRAITDAGIKNTDTLLGLARSIQSTVLNPDEKLYSLTELAETPKNYRSETLTNVDGDIIAQIVWDNKDRMVLFAMYPASGGTVVVSMTYDKEGNLTSNICMTYDEEGNIIEQVDLLAQREILLAARRSVMATESLLVSSNTPEALVAKTDEFGYDHLGNRTTVYLNKGVMAQETLEYSHNPVNQYSGYESSFLGGAVSSVYSFAHDDNGNLLVDENGNTYFYDYRNRLIEVQDPNSDTIAEYSYDALGRRIRKTVDSVTTYFIYDPQGRVIAEYEGSTPTLAREFVYGNGFSEVLAMFTPYHAGDPDDWDDFVELVEAWLCVDPNDACYNGTYDHNNDDIVNFEDFAYFAGIWDIPSNKESDWYYLHDALGSVRGLVGGRFNREEDREFYNYDVYGKLSVQDGEESQSGNPILFAGYRFDAETGLYHTPGRTYDPESGRWLQPDPIGYADSWNLYEYVMGNPVRYYDPYGLSCAGSVCGVGSLKDDLIDLLASEFADGSNCCGGKPYNQEKECCENNRIVEKQPVFIINRGGPNQVGSQQGSPNWTGGHVDMAIPGLGMIGFFGTRGGGLGNSIGMGLEGYFNETIEDWIRPITEGGRVNYIVGRGMALRFDRGREIPVPGVLSIICRIDVCPFQIRQMQDKYRELQKNPGKFNIIGRNCSSVAAQIIAAGGVLRQGIQGIDNPKDMMKQLQSIGAKCFSGYTEMVQSGQVNIIMQQ